MHEENARSVPEIRFKGFEGMWLTKRLGEVTSNISNNTLSRANLNYSSGLAKNIHYGDILVRFGSTLDMSRDNVPFVSDDIVARKLQPTALKDGDVVLADAAEDEMVGKCTELHNVGEQIVLAGLHTIALRPQIRFAPYFLGYYLNSNAYRCQLLPLMQGTKVLSISKTAIRNTRVRYPANEKEQEKLGVYFRNLDNIIRLHEEKYGRLLTLKKAMLQKMFPQAGATIPEIRFKGFDGEWVKKTFSEIVDVYDGTHQTPRYKKTGVMFLSVENIHTLKSEKFISVEDFEREFKIYPKRGDVLLTRIGDIGTANVVDSDAPLAYYVSLALLKLKSGCPYFLKYAISSDSMVAELYHRTLHVAFPKKINKNEIEKVNILVPPLTDEQQKIGAFFCSLDTLIAKHANQVEKLQQIKSACTEKMFVEGILGGDCS